MRRRLHELDRRLSKLNRVRSNEVTFTPAENAAMLADLREAIAYGLHGRPCTDEIIDAAILDMISKAEADLPKQYQETAQDDAQATILPSNDPD